MPRFGQLQSSGTDLEAIGGVRSPFASPGSLSPSNNKQLASGSFLKFRRGSLPLPLKIARRYTQHSILYNLLLLPDLPARLRISAFKELRLLIGLGL